MQSRDFVYWLQGFFEINEAGGALNGMSAAQVETVRNHLNMVFKHEIDPAMGDQKHQDALTHLHKPDGGTVLFRC